MDWVNACGALLFSQCLACSKWWLLMLSLAEVSGLQEGPKRALITYIIIPYMWFIFSLSSTLNAVNPLCLGIWSYILPVLWRLLYVCVYIFFQRWNLSGKTHSLGMAIKQIDLNWRFCFPGRSVNPMYSPDLSSLIYEASHLPVYLYKAANCLYCCSPERLTFGVKVR